MQKIEIHYRNNKLRGTISAILYNQKIVSLRAQSFTSLKLERCLEGSVPLRFW